MELCVGYGYGISWEDGVAIGKGNSGSSRVLCFGLFGFFGGGVGRRPG